MDSFILSDLLSRDPILPRSGVDGVSEDEITDKVDTIEDALEEHEDKVEVSGVNLLHDVQEPFRRRFRWRHFGEEEKQKQK